MRIKIIQIGKTRQKYFQEAENEYLKRLQAYGEVDVLNLKEYSDLPAPEAKKREAEEILQALERFKAGGGKGARRAGESAQIVVLDEHGKGMDSPAFADFLRKIRDFGGGEAVFIIGGTFGLAKEVLDKANLVLSFSKFTFTHEMIRTLLLEQVYRAFTIIAGKKYHY